jgi:GT2 family glycosyltransferase
LSRHVTIVILCWNRWALTERCLGTLRRNTDLSEATVLVVDNGSTDETPERLKDYDWLRTIRNPKNLGFVRGNNVGIAAADPAGDVLLLNNDVEIHQPDWLQRLREAAGSAPDVGVVGCRLVLPDGRLLHAGTYILPDNLWGQQIGALEADVGQYPGIRDVEGIVFACAYIRRELIGRIGGLSEKYLSYFEDTDYCLRASEAGYRTVVSGDVTLVHAEHGSTSDTPDLFRGLFAKSQKTFGQEWKKKLESRYTRALSWRSIMNFATGYAMSCREFIRALDGLGVRSSYSYVYGPGTPFPVREEENTGDHLLNVVSGRRTAHRPAVEVVYGQGDVFGRNQGSYRIGFTMLEVDGFPAEWVRQANRMDEVWVPTEFNRQGFLRSGVTKPIHVLPLGVDVDHFHPGIRSVRNPSGDFVFLSNFEWGERKQPELLLKVFNRVFRRDDPVVLVCKVIQRNGGLKIRPAIEALGLKDSGGRIAFVYNREFPYSQLGVLYRSADCYVSAGRGEGWDMPLMEAMACGLPTIATDWGAHTDFVHDGISYPLKVPRTIRAKALCPYYDGFSWADPDSEHLGVLLRHVYENREEAAGVGNRAAAEMASRWTWKHAAQRIVNRLDAAGIARAPA